MSMASYPSYKYYQTGGSLDSEASSYVSRQADHELVKNLEAMEYCYIFNARQMGKSSLRVRAMKELEDKKDKDFSCVVIDMTEICTYKVSQKDFYSTIISHLVGHFKIDIPQKEWWDKQTTTYMVRLITFIQEVLLEKVNKNIVIFVEEIDRIIKVEFKDEFFSFLRSCYSKRDGNDKYKRLTFALLGVATPFDLIADNQITAFNFGQEIELTGFKIDETEPLQDGLKKLREKISDRKAVLEQVLFWTGGQPYLTQKLCKIILDNYSSTQNSEENKTIEKGKEKETIQQLVQDCIINNWLKNDSQKNLITINDRLNNSPNSIQLLNIYKQILEGQEIAFNKKNPIHMEILLSGLVVESERKLKVYNRIYESVFNKSWVETELKTISSNLEQNNSEVETELKTISSNLEQNNSEVETEIEKLYEGLKAGDFCYVLSSQISEKNKCLRQTEKFIEDQNIQFAILDPHKVYDDWDREWTERHYWYLIVAEIINEEFNLNYPPKNWWKQNQHLERDPNRGQKLLITYIETWLLTKIKEPNVIIIFDSFVSRNEADIVKYRHLFDVFDGLDFKDDIFNFICLCYEKRKINHDFKRLTFLLLDVIMNPRLIREDIKNIIVAWRTNLDKTSKQKEELIIAQGLNQKFKNTNYKIILDRILYWTSGHPFLTQKLLHLVLSEQSNVTPGKENEYVDSLIDQKIITSFKSAQKDKIS